MKSQAIEKKMEEHVDPNGAATPEGGRLTDHLGQEEREVIELLRTPRLGIKRLPDTQKQKIRESIHNLHYTKGFSVTDISRLVGNKSSGYTSWLCKQLEITVKPFEESRLLGIKQKRRKYERNPFNGSDQDKAYYIGIKHGDVAARKEYKTCVTVSTSTPHPAMIKLFKALFEPYGHVYETPRYRKPPLDSEWNLLARIDSSFDFLLEPDEMVFQSLIQDRKCFLSYLAAFTDAEGSISITEDEGKTQPQRNWYNTNRERLVQIKSGLEHLGYHPTGPHLDKEKGESSSKYEIKRKKDYWKLSLSRFEEVLELLAELQFRHQEKMLWKEIALSLKYRQPWKEVEYRVLSLRMQIHRQVRQCKRQVEQEWHKHHPKPT